jgi:transcriptional regulator with XRE-family HTH domain
MAMTPGRKIAVRSPRLATELHQLRLASGLSGDVVAGRTTWSTSKISRIENGKSPLSLADVEMLLDLYKVSGDRRKALLALAEAAVTGDLRGGTGQRLVRSEYDDARDISEWAPLVVPRLMRTAAYADAAARSGQRVLRTLPSFIELEIATITRQQQRLSGPDAPVLKAVLDESVLYRQFSSCGKDVMREQAGYLAELAALAAVSLRVTSAGSLSGTGQFTYCSFAPIAGVGLPASVIIERLEAVTKLRAEEDTWTYKLAFDELWEHAAGEAGTSQALDSAIRHWS